MLQLLLVEGSWTHTMSLLCVAAGDLVLELLARDSQQDQATTAASSTTLVHASGPVPSASAAPVARSAQ